MNVSKSFLIERAIELDIQSSDLEWGTYTGNVRAIADILGLDYKNLAQTVQQRFLASVE